MTMLWVTTATTWEAGTSFLSTPTALRSVASQDPRRNDGSERILAASIAVCTAAYWHQPLFSSRSGGTNPEMLPLFQALFDADADVVINGNDHFYERFLPQDPTGEDDGDGIVQFTVGTGGRSFDEFGGPTRNSGVRFNQSVGVLALSLSPTSYRMGLRHPTRQPVLRRRFGRLQLIA